MPDSLVWFHMKYRGTEYELDLKDLTVQRLSQIKQWYGKEYGTFNGLPTLIGELDAQAWACAVWIGQQKAGQPVEDPRHMEFSFDDFEGVPEPELVVEDEPDEVPTAGDSTPPILDLVGSVSTSSETDTSSGSQTSADSHPTALTFSRSSTS